MFAANYLLWNLNTTILEASLYEQSPIFMINGPPGAGKTTVATRLLQRFALGLHIPVDDLREWVVSGIAHPVPQWTDETTRQFQLARQSAVHTALLYNSARFAVVIDDLVFAAEAETNYVEPLRTHILHKILLLPDVDVALARNKQRQNKQFDTASLVETIRALRQSMAEQPFTDLGWLTLDNSRMTIDETVDAILRSV
jgi:thymidylate kinase